MATPQDEDTQTALEAPVRDGTTEPPPPFVGGRVETTVPIGLDLNPEETFERIRGSFSNAKEADIHIMAFRKVSEVLRAMLPAVPPNFKHFEAMSVEFVSCLVDKGLIVVSEEVFNSHVNEELEARWTKRLEQSGFTPEEPGNMTAAQVEEAMREFIGGPVEDIEEHIVCMCVLPDNDVAKRDVAGPHHVAECPLYDADAAEYE